MSKQEFIKTLKEWKTFRKKEKHELQYYQLAEVIGLAKELDEPEITVEKAWNKIAESYPESVQTLRNALDNVVFGNAGKSQKPVVPQFVADLVDWTRRSNGAPSDVIREFQTKTPDTVNLPDVFELEKLDEYFKKAHQRYDFEKGCFVGYEVERLLYYVPLPFEVWDEEAAELKKEFLYLAYDLTSDETRFFPTKEARRGFSTKLDEITIKSADENYWPFAVPVEEVAEE